MKKQNKKKIGVGSVVKREVGEFEDIAREGRIRSMRKYLVLKKRFLVQFKDKQKKEIIYSLLVLLSFKEEDETDEPIYHYREIEQG